MKLFYFLLLTLPLLGHSYPAKEAKSLALDDVHVEEQVDSEHAGSDNEAQIQKRSGSFDYVTHLKSGLLSSIGHASASIASGSSGASSGSGGQKSYGGEHHGNSVSYDPWSFKKAVLNTIFQAVKAITGGVTALKGQLIKGSGYALNASGNLVAASGDKITDVGKAIINSAQIHSHGYDYGHSGGGGGVGVSGSISLHPFAKFSSLSGSSSSGGSKHSSSPPVVHTETITTYEIPAGHSNYGPPSKPPTYSSATHQYLPPPSGGAGYSGGGAPFSVGHAAFEAPPNNYLPTAYGHDGHNDFNLYGRHKKLTYDEERKAVAQLQDILNMLPNGKTEYTASKTVQLATPSAPTGPHHHIHPDHVELQTYGLPQDLGPLESLSHTESITAAYGPRPQQPSQENPSDVYRQMAKKQSPEVSYIQAHPNEGYDYRPTPLPDTNGYKYSNYHATNTKSALNDLTPIIAALEVAKRRTPSEHGAHAQYTVEKSVHKVPPAEQFKQLPHAVQKSKYTYFDPSQSKGDGSHYPVYDPSYKVRRNVPPPRYSRPQPLFRHHDDPLLFNQMMTF